MQKELAILETNGEYHVDSRLLAQYLGYKHETIARNIQRHKARLEKKSSLRQVVGVKQRTTRGATREVYYLLDQRQCLILTGSLKKGEEAEEWQDAIIDAFLQARVQELESAQSRPQQHKRPLHALSDAMRPRALENLGNVPEGHFSVMGELFKHLYNLEALIDQVLDEKAMIEISVGQLWSIYAREKPNIPDQERCRYAHRGPGGREVQAWAYPLQYAGHFEKWLWNDYFPAHFESYRRYRARHVAIASARAGQKSLLGPHQS